MGILQHSSCIILKRGLPFYFLGVSTPVLNNSRINRSKLRHPRTASQDPLQESPENPHDAMFNLSLLLRDIRVLF